MLTLSRSASGLHIERLFIRGIEKNFYIAFEKGNDNNGIRISL